MPNRKVHPELLINYRRAETAVINLLKTNDQRVQAELVIREGLAKREAALPPNHADIAFTKQKLAALLIDQQRHDEAEPLLREAFDLLKDHPIAPNARAQDALDQIIGLYEAWDQPDELAKWRAVTVQYPPRIPMHPPPAPARMRAMSEKLS